VLLGSQELVSCLKGAIRGRTRCCAGTDFRSADIVLASDSCWLQVPFSALGLVPEFGSAINFPQSIGVHRANEFLMFGRKLTATELEAWGLANQIFPTSSFQKDVQAYLEDKLAVNDGKSMMEAKRLMNAPLRDGRMVAVQNAMDALAERFGKFMAIPPPACILMISLSRRCSLREIRHQEEGARREAERIKAIDHHAVKWHYCWAFMMLLRRVSVHYLTIHGPDTHQHRRDGAVSTTKPVFRPSFSVNNFLCCDPLVKMRLLICVKLLCGPNTMDEIATKATKVTKRCKRLQTHKWLERPSHREQGVSQTEGSKTYSATNMNKFDSTCHPYMDDGLLTMKALRRQETRLRMRDYLAATQARDAETTKPSLPLSCHGKGKLSVESKDRTPSPAKASQVSIEANADNHQARKSDLSRAISLADLVNHNLKASPASSEPHTCVACRSDLEPALRPSGRVVAPKVFAVDNIGSITEVVIPDDIRPALAGAIGSRSRPVLLSENNGRPRLFVERNLRKQLRLQRPKASVRFNDETEVQHFDNEAPATHAVCTDPSFQPISDKISKLRSRAKQLIRRPKQTYMQVRFRVIDGVNEFHRTVQVSLAHALRFTDLVSYIVHQLPDCFGAVAEPPNWVRFRLVREDLDSYELIDAKEYLKPASLKKWILIDEQDEWSTLHIDQEYRRFIALFGSAQREFRCGALEIMIGDRSLRDLVMLKSRKQETGEEIRRRLRAQKIHPVVEFLWEK
jgi:hypothetical protein